MIIFLAAATPVPAYAERVERAELGALPAHVLDAGARAGPDGQRSAAAEVRRRA